MNDPAIALITQRIKELTEEAQRVLAPYNAAISELHKLREALLPPPEPTPEKETDNE